MKRKGKISYLLIVIIFSSIFINSQLRNAEQKPEKLSVNVIITTPSAPEQSNLCSVLVPHSPIVIIEDGNFSDYGFPGTGTPANPFVIAYYNISTIGQVDGIYIFNTTKHFSIHDCYISSQDGNGFGVNLDNVAIDTAVIMNNTCFNKGIGIRAYYAESTAILNNSIIIPSGSFGLGMRIWSCSHSIVENNTFIGNYQGIRAVYSSYCNITNNIFCNNTGMAIKLESCSHSLIKQNTLNNNYYGIYIDYSDDSNFVYNNINDSYRYAITLYSSTNCFLHHNFMYNNNWIGDFVSVLSQAYCGRSDNYWYDPLLKEGNFWNDYSGYGEYRIDGPGGVSDPYPLNEQGNPLISEFQNKHIFVTVLIMQFSFILILIYKKKKMQV